MIRTLILFCFIVLLASCRNDTPRAEPLDETNIPVPGGENSELIAKLYENYTNDPKSQAQKDENSIIEYLAKRNAEFERYPNGLYVQIRKEGEGPKYVQGQPSKVDYRGFTLDGKIFDSSFKRGRPMDFKVGQMIPGWTQAQKNMNPGTEATILIPSYLAYGTRGFPGAVPPNTVIGFDKYYKKLSE